MTHTTHLIEVKDTQKAILGFWIYLMTDCVLFATLFATYAVLRNNTAGGPAAQELFSLPFVLVETLLLLTSSFTAGLALLAGKRGYIKATIHWLIVTFILGAAFLGMELFEFSELYREGHSWQSSAFLSAFFTLVGTHGLHITAGLIWAIVLIVQFARKGLHSSALKRLTLFGIFWHFLDIVWIFIFSVVYLLGAAT